MYVLSDCLNAAQKKKEYYTDEVIHAIYQSYEDTKILIVYGV